jgi:hypothetical protein
MATKKRQTKRVRTESKMDCAVKIMEKMFFRQGKERKEILPVPMDECGLTKAGASTYYQTIRTRILEDES